MPEVSGRTQPLKNCLRGRTSWNVRPWRKRSEAKPLQDRLPKDPAAEVGCRQHTVPAGGKKGGRTFDARQCQQQAAGLGSFSPGRICTPSWASSFRRLPRPLTLRPGFFCRISPRATARSAAPAAPAAEPRPAWSRPEEAADPDLAADPGQPGPDPRQLRIHRQL